MAGMTAHLLLVDDHALFRSGVSMMLTSGLKAVQIFEAASLEEALLCSSDTLDLVLLDIKLEGINGLNGIALLKRRWPLAKVLVVSGLQGPRVEQEALAHGAQGFVCKAEAPARMLELITQMLAGDVQAQSPLSDASGPSIKLTPRQWEVLDLLSQGLSNKMIGRQLNLSENTVRGHVQATLLALQVSSRSQATFVARRMGLID
ncbi:two component transcriptional regulator, LuxR family [Pseudomonas sp. ok272]|uniref:response regulator n=1 Tax=unclassified Pseudomonas TaxID=196821 RepID=UPI0008C6E783|nr:MULTISPECIES: response regulator transcription factor [unclassified Pseudomonas]SEN11446.1 two component transcriptional regulator, LuxR family [Pseudomonas sp. ok272]SFN04520.1 two component transcriptional regulator, LuxR family [Pseudomonas sp. ok602]